MIARCNCNTCNGQLEFESCAAGQRMDCPHCGIETTLYIPPSPHATEVYITSNCRLCGGSIEFPEHGLGETIECPHCNEQIELRRLAEAERLLLLGRLWFREHALNWRCALGAIVVLIVCGTAGFIYMDYKAELRKQEEQRAKQEQERITLEELQLEELEEANRQAAARAEEERLDALYKPSDPTPASEIPYTLAWREKRRQQQSLEEIKAELRRANNLAERGNNLAEQAAFQRRFEKIREDADRSWREYEDQINVIKQRSAAYSFSASVPQVVVPPLGTTIGSYDPNSLANPYGAGSPFKPDGLMNPYSQYGSPYSPKSWRNPYATDAPRLYDSQGNYRGKLSANPYDPDSTSNPYGRYGSPYSGESINNPYGPGSPYRSDPVYVVPSR